MTITPSRLVRRLFGKLFGDKGYISQALAEQLLVTQGLHLITKLRKNMRNILMPLADKLLLRQRAIIERINDQLKNICQIEHTRHRSPRTFLAHLFAGPHRLLSAAEETLVRSGCPCSGQPLVIPNSR